MQDRPKIKVTAISDLHGYLPEISKCDLLLIAGDIVPLEYQQYTHHSVVWFATSFIPWVNKLDVDRVIFIAGNHDRFLESLRGFGRSPRETLDKLTLNGTLCSKLTYLCNSGTMYQGYNIWGSPDTPRLDRWAFFADAKKLHDDFQLISSKTDILLTHCPPMIKDFGKILEKPGDIDAGCNELAARVLKVCPRYHVFGHIHSGSHIPEDIGGTIYNNVSIKNEEYKVTYKPYTFTLE